MTMWTAILPCHAPKIPLPWRCGQLVDESIVFLVSVMLSVVVVEVGAKHAVVPEEVGRLLKVKKQGMTMKT